MRLPEPEQENGGPNLTPIIDVVFLLLIFFLVATQFAQKEREITTRLPQVVQARPLAGGSRQIIVNISETGEYKVVAKTYSSQQLSDLLHSEAVTNPGLQTVLIRADERVPFKFPAEVMGFCEREGMKFSCAVETPQESGG